MIKTMLPQSYSESSHKSVTLNSKKLALPPIKWKNKSQDADALSNISKKVTPQTDSTINLDNLKRKSGQLFENKTRGILKSSYSCDLIKGLRNCSLSYNKKKVTFIDETLNKPIAQYDDGDDNYVKVKKKNVCACVVF